MKKIFFSLLTLFVLQSPSFVADAAIARDITCGRFGQPDCQVVEVVNQPIQTVRVNVRSNIRVNSYGRYSQSYTGNTYNFLNNSVSGVYTQQAAPVSSNTNSRTYVQTKRTDKESFKAYNPYPSYNYLRPVYVYPVYNRVVTRTYIRPVYSYFY